jgi:hypothetical protein
MEWSAPGWGVHGRLDMVELGQDEVIAVEAKRGSAPTADRHRWQDFELPHRAWPPDVAQLGLYMAALRDAGLPCSEGRLFYRGNGVHTVIAWTDELERFLRAVVAEARRVRSLPVAPDPLESSPKCIGCSLHGVCLPDEHHALKAEAAAREAHPIRRILPGRDDRAVVHVTRPGTLVRKEGESLVVCPRDGEPERLLLKDIAHVALYGPVQVTEQCMQLLLMQGVPVSHHTSAGRLLGLSAPMLSQNIHLRRAQFRAADDPGRSLEAARALVLAKIRNQRTVLRRYGRGVEQTLCDESGDLPDWASTDNDTPAPRLDARTRRSETMIKTTPPTTPPSSKRRDPPPIRGSAAPRPCAPCSRPCAARARPATSTSCAAARARPPRATSPPSRRSCPPPGSRTSWAAAADRRATASTRCSASAIRCSPATPPRRRPASASTRCSASSTPSSPAVPPSRST